MTISGSTSPAATRRIRLGMIGGGEGAFIGAVHRIASRLDDHYDFIAGALSSTPEKAERSGIALGLAPDRIYPDWQAMLAGESARPPGERIQAVAIVTPNHVHVPPAIAFLKAGFHVICDKPLGLSLAEAKDLRAVLKTGDRVFCLTHNYTGYPLVRHARAMVAAGDLGEIRVVQVEYVQDWLTEKLEATGQKQSQWRVDPAQSGAGGAIGDIGTHAFQLACYVSGLSVQELAADLTAFVPGRRLDDHVQVLLRFEGGARGILWASQVCPGNENGLKLRIYGTKGGLEWLQEHPNQLKHTPFGQPARILSRATGAVGPEGARVTRVPAGHPEGYLEAFATLYAEAAAAIRAAEAGSTADPAVQFPGIADGVEGMAFIEAAVASSAANAAWTGLDLS